jgi:hypothetical protein
MIFKEINGKEIIDDLFSTRDNQLETEKSNKADGDKVSDKADGIVESKPKKLRKPRTPKKNK